MTFLNPAEPLVRSKQEALDFQDRQGLLRIHLQVGTKTLVSSFYSRIDQAFMVWGWITAAIFINAQFLPVSWYVQAMFWSALTLIGTVGMVVLTHFWVKVERLRWLLYSWVVLMLFGVVLTDLALFLGWGLLLMNLCQLWLGLSTIGYFFTGVGMRSRTFLINGLVHLLGMAILPYVGAWQFLTTGLVMAGTLLLLAEVQWDMRSPIDYDVLTPEQKQFNQEQHQLRQMII
ncbi:hypothetical protein [Coleofasciculus sp. H7-2]|uniref:hypothetical protein n=1 Tax=Coleofasciculus sp. H7-2 TaxID=3351545 RepID=UPI00366E49FE